MSALSQTPSQMLQGLHRPYSPPTGYVDFPFTYIYDPLNPNGTQVPLVNGNSYPNQFIAIDSGYGDFVLRRVLGLDTMLNTASGQYRLRWMNGSYMTSLPVCVGTGGAGSLAANSAQLAVLPEQFYKELSQIRFDLYDIQLALQGAQLGFQGIRRLPITVGTGFKYRPKHYAYVTNAALLGGIPGFPQQTTQVIQPVSNYDFDLYQVFLFFQDLLYLPLVEGTNGGLVVQPALPEMVNPDSLVFTVITPVGDNLPLTVTVSGSTVTVSPATNGAGAIISTAAQVAAAVNATPAAAVLIVVTAITDVASTLTPVGTGVVLGPFMSADDSFATCLLFDQNTVQCSNVAMLDIFMNAGSYYRNGAIVPPLWYQQNSRIRMDVTLAQFKMKIVGSQPLWLTINYVGRQRVPC
jgi:hypothetical protein